MSAKTTRAERVQRRRAKLRAAGSRPAQIWLQDTRAPGFAEEYGRQCRQLALPENIDREVVDFIDANNADIAAELDRLEG